ncbi:MAG TPA: hypothetical protein VK110_09270 [Salinisphaeraceae bacterium]|nr:hypothetical protein [Salinisphaeraceae bacterium]
MLDRVTHRLRSSRRLAISLQQHLDGAADWLAQAQDVSADDGVPAYYNAKTKRWAASYPETTGYIIPTLYRYAKLSGRAEFAERATRMAHWESSIQLPDGAVRAGTMDADKIVPTIFNTGQVLFGWAAAWEETGAERFRQSLVQAADWLLSAQDNDGAWRNFASPYALDGVNTYNTRVAFGLARTAQALDDERYAQAAKTNVDWALTQVRANGWLDNNDLQDNHRPLTHTIAYAIRGILEVGMLTDTPRFVSMAEKMADSVASAQRRDGALPGRLDMHWRAATRWSCLTGNAQMAIVWQRLAALDGKPKWRDHARRCMDFTRATQNLAASDIACRGGIAGSWPRSGEYMRWRYPNWAAKFFMDALMPEVYD